MNFQLINFYFRSLFLQTNFNADQISSTAQTFTSNIPSLKPISLTVFSFTYIMTFDKIFGREIQNDPEYVRCFFYITEIFPPKFFFFYEALNEINFLIFFCFLLLHYLVIHRAIQNNFLWHLLYKFQSRILFRVYQSNLFLITCLTNFL